MNIENRISNRADIALSLDNDVLNVNCGDNGSEYAVIITYCSGTERMLDIIRYGQRSFTIEKTKDVSRISLVDIYSDEEVFLHIFPENIKTIPEDEKNEENKEIIIQEKEYKERKTKMNNSQTPPPLLTKKRELTHTDTSFLDRLPSFGGFDCVTDQCDMRVFDEKMVMKEKFQVNYNKMKVPAWYPFLGYSDRSAEGSTLPCRIIGVTNIDHTDYLTYGILTDIKKGIQPFFGTTGFVYLVPYDHKYAYWMMFLDLKTGNIAYPYDEDIMQAE